MFCCEFCVVFWMKARLMTLQGSMEDAIDCYDWVNHTSLYSSKYSCNSHKRVVQYTMYNITVCI